MFLLDEFYRIELHWTTLQKAAKRLPKNVWQSLLGATVCSVVELGAGDGTTFQRSDPSKHYLKRIDSDEPVGRPVQFVTLIDVKKKKFLAANCFAKPRHEAQCIPALHKKSPKMSVLLLDKGFDAEWLHTWLNEHGTFAITPTRKNCRRGRYRKVMRDCMDWCLYWQRNIIESLFSALKRLFGTSVKSKHIKTQTAELFCRLITYNIGYRLWTFSTEPGYP